MSRIATTKIPNRNRGEAVCTAPAGQRPIAMPEAKAATMATAGSLIRGALTLRAFRCDRSAERDRKSPRNEFRSGGLLERSPRVSVAFALGRPDRGQEPTDRRQYS